MPVGSALASGALHVCMYPPSGLRHIIISLMITCVHIIISQRFKYSDHIRMMMCLKLSWRERRLLRRRSRRRRSSSSSGTAAGAARRA
jgi:hypothetical protein